MTMKHFFNVSSFGLSEIFLVIIYSFAGGNLPKGKRKHCAKVFFLFLLTNRKLVTL